MLALAAAYGVSRLAERDTPLALKLPGLLLVGLLALGGLFYPAAAILAGVVASWLWRAGTASRVASGALMGLAVIRAVWEWLRPLAGWQY